MYNETYFMISVVILAFIAGYAIVSFVMNKMKSKKDVEGPTKQFRENGHGSSGTG